VSKYGRKKTWILVNQLINNYKAQLFDPEIEATYNDIKQLKRDLEIRNREVGQMMALLVFSKSL
jgi:hypothetical protein